MAIQAFKTNSILPVSTGAGEINNFNIGGTTRGNANFLSINANQAVTFATLTNEISIGTNQTTGGLTLGGTDQTAAITIGRSVQSQNIIIGAGNLEPTRTRNINIATNSQTNSTNNVTIGGGTGTNTTTINGALVVNATTSNINVATAQTTGNITIGGTTNATGNITLGQSTSSQIVNIATGGAGNGTAKQVNIGTNSTGSGTTAITLGAIANASITLIGAVTIQADTENTSISTGQTTGTITIGGTTNATGTITLGQSTAAQIVNIATGTTGAGITKQVNIGTGATDGSTSIVLGSVSSITSVNCRLGSSGVARFARSDTQYLDIQSNANGHMIETVSSNTNAKPLIFDSRTAGNLQSTVGNTNIIFKTQSVDRLSVLENGNTEVYYDLSISGAIKRSGSISREAPTAGNGVFLSTGVDTFTDTSSTTGSVITTRAIASVNTATLESINPITITRAASLYVANPPSAGNNTTLTNSYAILVNNGMSRFQGDVETTSNLSASTLKIGLNTTNAFEMPSADSLSAFYYTDKSLSILATGTSPQGMYFRPDGTRFYIVDDNTDTISQYNLSTPWDISTATFTAGQSFSVAGQDTAPNGVYFRSDGIKMYMVGSTTDAIYQYTLATAWDVTTATYDNVSFSVSAQDTNPRDLYFKDDGLEFYVIGDTNDVLYRYTLTTAWDISTASYSNVSFAVAAASGGSPQSVWFNEAGTKFYIVGNLQRKITEYTMSTPWTITTAVATAFFSTVFESSSTGLYISESQRLAFFVGNGGDRIYEFKTSDAIETKTLKAYYDGDVEAMGYITSNKGVQTTNLNMSGNASVGGNLSTTGTVTTANATFTFGNSTNSIAATAQTTGAITFGGTAATGAITIGQSTAAQTVNIGTGAVASNTTGTINIGTGATTGGATPGTRNVNIATGGAAGSNTNVSIGSANGTSTTTINGAVSLAATTQNISIGTGLTTGTLTLGGTTQTAAITLGRSTVTQEINIGTGITISTNSKIINIGTNSANGSSTTINIGDNGNPTASSFINIGNYATFGITDVNVAGNLYQYNGDVELLSNTPTGYIYIHNGQTTGPIELGSGLGTGNIIIGQSVKTQSIQISNNFTESGQSNTISIATRGMAGSFTDVLIGSSNGTSTTTLNGVNKYTATDALAKTITTASPTMNLSEADMFMITVTAATTFSFLNPPPAGRAKYITLEITNGGNFAVTWPTNTRWPNGAAPSLTSNGVDVVVFYTDDGGTNYRAALVQKDSK